MYCRSVLKVAPKGGSISIILEAESCCHLHNHQNGMIHVHVQRLRKFKLIFRKIMQANKLARNLREIEITSFRQLATLQYEGSTAGLSILKNKPPTHAFIYFPVFFQYLLPPRSNPACRTLSTSSPPFALPIFHQWINVTKLNISWLNEKQ